MIAASLAVVGLLILLAGRKERRQPGTSEEFSFAQALIQGFVQALCLPFRGLSRSGSTISVALLQGINRVRAEEFSFALAVLLTPAAIAYEGYKLVGTHHTSPATSDQQAAGLAPAGATTSSSTVPTAPEKLSDLLLPGLAGMAFSFLAGLVGLWWLSRVAREWPLALFRHLLPGGLRRRPGGALWTAGDALNVGRLSRAVRRLRRNTRPASSAP